MRALYRAALAIALTLLTAGITTIQAAPEAAAPGDAPRQAASDAYIYGYPLVLMDASRAKMSNVPQADPKRGLAPINQLGNVSTFPDAHFTDVVSPNADTLYSNAWLDLSVQPIVLSLPDTHGRYYLIQLMDAWTNVFASPGKRTTGTGPGDFAITGPHWSGTLPAGLKQIKSPTDMVWMIGRTQANGTSDFAAVNALQAQYKLTPLDAWGKTYEPSRDVPLDPKVDMKTSPVDVVAAMDASTFFNRLSMLMRNNPPAAADAAAVANLRRIGLVPGQPFDINSHGDASARQIAAGYADGQKRLIELAHHPTGSKHEGGWMIATHNVGTYGTNYDARAGVAMVGLGANLPEDAIYPMAREDSDGHPLDGSHKYVIHFDKGQTPPVNAFWSLTMYNARQAFVDNPLNRYAIGDRDKLKYNPDGSLDIYIQHDSPGKDRESNWLPADAGSFNLILRLYWPKEEVASGAWLPPPIRKVD